MNPQWLWLLIPLIPLGIVAFWCLVCFIIALAGGWHTLSKSFRTSSRPQGRMLGMQRALIGAAQYKGVLTLCVTPEGLYMAVFPLFRAGHPPLLIPWSAMAPLKPRRWFWFTAYDTSVRAGNNTVSISFLDRDIAQAVGAYLAVPH